MGQIFIDEHEIPIGDDIPSGTYLVTAGMYHLDPVQNLPVLSGPTTLPGDRMVIAQIEIRNDQ
ncbi:MAG: hypothetical protein IPK16_15100 [Anaerolineales bacterium]|nr:hypothetical protein [Anaerolineales bacterium]